jgi:thiamine biosynthesis lipoprotein
VSSNVLGSLQPMSLPPLEPGLHREWRELMGTVATITMHDADAARVQPAVAAAFERLYEIDRRFSPYKEESEISRISRGELTVPDAHPEVTTVLEACEALRVESGGRFSAWGFRADGRLDPSGYVKGWAIGEAAEVLRAGGIRNFILDIGGDVFAAGGPDPARGWGIGIVDPSDRAAIIAPLAVRDRSVATSGLAERGEHVIDARDGVAATEWASITVVHSSAARADAAATIALLMGEDALGWIDRDADAAAFAVHRDGRLAWTPRMERYLAGTVTTSR